MTAGSCLAPRDSQGEVDEVDEVDGGTRIRAGVTFDVAMT
jgi:hypothetical protein